MKRFKQLTPIGFITIILGEIALRKSKKGSKSSRKGKKGSKSSRKGKKGSKSSGKS